jgi:hypothetical protein
MMNKFDKKFGFVVFFVVKDFFAAACCRQTIHDLKASRYF